MFLVLTLALLLVCCWHKFSSKLRQFQNFFLCFSGLFSFQCNGIHLTTSLDPFYLYQFSSLKIRKIKELLRKVNWLWRQGTGQAQIPALYPRLPLATVSSGELQTLLKLSCQRKMFLLHPFLSLSLWWHQPASQAAREHKHNWKGDRKRSFNFSSAEMWEFWGNTDSSEIFAFLQACHQLL